MRSGELKQRMEFSSLVTGEWGWLDRALDDILVKVDQNKVIGWKFNLLVPTLNTDNVRTRRFQCLDEPCREDRN
jgi:hypothetical protein